MRDSDSASISSDAVARGNRAAAADGWRQVYALSITETVSWGVLYYAFAVMLAPMQAELGWTKAQLTGAFSLALLVSGGAAVFVGRIIDRRGARLVMSVGSGCAALLVFAWANVTSLTAFYLIWIGIGITMAAVLYEPAFAVIATWFEQPGRNRALTVLTLCAGLASVIFVPLAEWLVRTFGWRTATLVLGFIALIVTLPLHWLVLRRAPVKKRQITTTEDNWANTVAGDENTAAAVVDAPPRRAPDAQVRDVVRSRLFWQLTAAFWLKTLASATITVHLIAYLVEHQFAAGFAALMIAAIGAAQLPGRVFFAAVNHHVSSRILVTGLFLLQAVALILLVFAVNQWWIWAFAVMFGASNGALTPARVSLVADAYGTTSYATIAGVVAAVVTVAQAAAPIGASLLYDAYGNYNAVIWVLIVTSGIATIAIFTAIKKQSPAAARF